MKLFNILLTYDFLLPAPCQPVPGIYTIEMIDTFGDGWQTNEGNGGNGITVDIDGVIIEVGMCSPYEALPYDGCVEGPSAATTYVEIPEGTQSAKWYFPGDWWGEIAFEIFDPNGISVYKVNGGEGVEAELPFEVCLD